MNCSDITKKLKIVEEAKLKFDVHFEQRQCNKAVDCMKEVEAIIESINLNRFYNFPDQEHYIFEKEKIFKKVKEGKPLTKFDLEFLYDMDFKVKFSGVNDFFRTAEILHSRNVKNDISELTGLDENEIIVSDFGGIIEDDSAKEVLSGRIKYYKASRLNFSSWHSLKGKLPEVISGDLWLNSLRSDDELEYPRVVGGSLDLKSLAEVSSKLPDVIGGALQLNALKTVETLTLPSKVGKWVYLNSVPKVEKDKLKERYPNLKIF